MIPSILGIAAIATAVSSSKFGELWLPPSNPAEMQLYIARILLFGVFAVWSYRFVDATHDQMFLWKKALDYVEPPKKARLAVAVTALYLGLLMSLPAHIVIASGFFTLSLLVNYWTQWMCNDAFYDASLTSKETYAGVAWRIQIIEKMEHFWLRLPQLARITTMMFFSSIAFSLALAGSVQVDPQRSQYELAAYEILIADVVIFEAWMFVWRRNLYKEIDDVLRVNGKLKHEPKKKWALV